MVIQNSHIRRGSKGDSTLFFFSLICIEQTPNTIDALYPPILVKKKYYYKLSSPPASHEAHLNFSSNYRVKKLHKFQLVEGLRGASKAPFKSLQQRFNQYFRTNKRDTPPNVEKTSSRYVCQLQVLFVYPCSILFPPQSSMHLPKFFSAAS